MLQLVRVLQVEDSESDAAFVVQRLCNAGYEVVSERVGDEQSLRDATSRARWDVVLSEYRVAGMDALVVLRILQATGLDIPLIVVSRDDDEKIVVGMMNAGARDFLTKENLVRLAPVVERELRNACVREECRRTEAALAEVQQRLAVAITAGGLGTFDYDLQTGTIVGGGSIRQQFGMPWSAEETTEVTSEQFVEMLHPDDRSRVREALQKAAQPGSGGYYAEEYRVVWEGGERWVGASGRVLFDDTGRPLRLIAITRDVTGRKNAERAAQFHLELTQKIAQQSTEAICIITDKQKPMVANAALERLFGFKSEEWQPDLVHDMVHHHYPDGRPYPLSECPQDKSFREGVPIIEQENLYFHKDGTPIPVAVSMVPVHVGGSQPSAILTIRDLSERKRNEQMTRNIDETMKRLFEMDVIGLLLGDGDSVFDANDYFLELLQYTRDDLRKGELKFSVINPPDQAGRTEKALQQIRRTGSAPAFEKEYVRKDGSRVPALTCGFSVSRTDPILFLVFVFDLRERKNLENQIRQAQKMESVGLLAGSVAHDFNNLLTVILGCAERAAKMVEFDDRLRKDIERILLAATRADELTSKLLKFSRGSTAVPRVFNLNEVVQETHRLLTRLIGENISLTLSLGRDDLNIRADPGEIQQVIMNLALNARDAMPHGGELHLATSKMPVEDDFSAASTTVPIGSYVELSVTDTGSGMAPEISSHIFEPFFTTKEQGKGTGLGLSTVYGIVRQSGGTVTVHSSPGLGSAFRVLFPSVATSPVTEKQKTPVAARGGSETVLLVEDDDLLRKHLLGVLSDHGYTVLDAANGSDAVELARRYRDPIDLLLTDTVLPDGLGSEFAAGIVAMRPEIRVVRVSGYLDHLARNGADTHFLQKPFSSSTLLHEIRAVLGGSVLRDGAATEDRMA